MSSSKLPQLGVAGASASLVMAQYGWILILSLCTAVVIGLLLTRKNGEAK